MIDNDTRRNKLTIDIDKVYSPDKFDGARNSQNTMQSRNKEAQPTKSPTIFKANKIDQILEVSEEEARAMTIRLAKEEGIFSGMSSGGSVATALKVAKKIDEGIIVAIICDRGDRYLSSTLFEKV